MYKKIGIILALFVVAFLAIIFLHIDKGIGNMKIYFFKAGKADAIFIYNNKFNILIDTGESDLANEIIFYLEEKNIDSIDYLIITHFDKDHVGSASKIIDRFDIKHVVDSNYPKDSDVYNAYVDSLNNKGISPEFPVTEMKVTLGDIDVYINPPIKTYDEDPSNNSSLIVKVVHNKNTFLFMADAEDDRIKDYLLDHKDESTLLKVPYHGKYQDTLEELVSVVKPKYSIITSGKKKMEDEETLKLLSKYNSKYYLTREGAILVTSDGENINVEQR